MTTTLAILASLGALGGLGGVVSLFTAKATKTRLHAEATKISTEARATDIGADDILLGRAIEMYEKALAAAERAEKRVTALDGQVRALRDHVDHLERIMRDADLEPPKFEWPRGA